MGHQCHQYRTARYLRYTTNYNYIVVGLFLSVMAPAYMMWHFGLTWQGTTASIFAVILVILAIVDLHHQLLPDKLTQPLLWLGLLVNLNGTFTSLHDAVIGAVSGYSVLWLVSKGYLLWRHQEGIGHGDFKLSAALGAWLGYKTLFTKTLIFALLGSGIIGLIAIFILLYRRKKNTDTPYYSLANILQTAIPFGPFLAAAGIWSILFPI